MEFNLIRIKQLENKIKETTLTDERIWKILCSIRIRSPERISRRDGTEDAARGVERPTLEEAETLDPDRGVACREDVQLDLTLQFAPAGNLLLQRAVGVSLEKCWARKGGIYIVNNSAFLNYNY